VVQVRDGDVRRITVKEGDAANKHCILVDDIVQSGGTLLECGKMLVERRAASVSAFCAHGVFPNDVSCSALALFLTLACRCVLVSASIVRLCRNKCEPI
jgi:phosphoribosylpyrophosphate synthetase